MSGHPLDFLKDYKATPPEVEPEQHEEKLIVEPIIVPPEVAVAEVAGPPPSDEKPAKKPRKKRVQITKREVARQAARERRRQGRGVINEKCACHLSCSTKINEEHRKVLNEKYWDMDLRDQKAFVKAHSEPGQVKRRRVPVDPLGGGTEVKKAFTYSFRLPDHEGELQSVCCTFFLNTIGFRQGCGNTIYRTHMKDITQDKRGKYERDRTLHDAVWDDILSYSPRTYHKGLKFSATALYLPTKLNAKMMHADFKRRQEAVGMKAGSGSFYCSVLREMDVHFVEMDDFEIPERKPIPIYEPKDEKPTEEPVPAVDSSAMVQQHYQQIPPEVQSYQPSPVAVHVHDQTTPIHPPYQMDHKPVVVHQYSNVQQQIVPQNYHIRAVKQEPYYGVHMQSMPIQESHFAEHDHDDYSESYSNMVEDHGYSESSFHDGSVIVTEEPKVEIIHEEYPNQNSYEESHDYKSQPPNMPSESEEPPAEKVPTKRKTSKRPPEATEAILPEGYPPIKRTKRFIARVSNKARRRQSHPVMQLDCNCIWNCHDKISLDQQERINAQYWDMGFCDQRLFLLEHTERHSIKRRRAKVPDEGPVRKGYTYSYKLTDSHGSYQNVCCQFFLNTLGFGAGSGNVIYRAHQVELSVAISDKRGKFARDRTLRDAVDDDILSHFTPEQQESRVLDLTGTDWTPKKLYNVHVKRQAVLGNDKPGSFAFYWRRTKELKVMFAPRPEPKAGGGGGSSSGAGKPRVRKRPSQQQQQQQQYQQPVEQALASGEGGGGYLYGAGASQ